MLVIRDALLSQLQNDRLRQEIIMVELGKIERAMALSSASHQCTASAVAERAEPVPFAFSEQFMPHSRVAVGPERNVGVDEVHDLKKKDGVHGGIELNSQKPAMEDLVRECLKTSCGTDKAGGQENAALDECKLQKSNETILSKRTSPSVKWSCAICLVEATSEGNLLQHFAGLKHRSNVIALKAKAKARAEKSRKVRQYAEKPCPTWVCRFCQANCTCKSDLENHLKGKRHQAKIQALLEESKSMARNSVHWEADSHPNIVPQDEEKPASSILICSICQVKCTCQSVVESHLRGKKHQMNFQALQLEAKRVGNMPPQIAKNQQPPKKWGCSICQAKCNSESQFEDHCRSMGHQKKIEALHREGTNAQSSSQKTAGKESTFGWF
ncbi:UBP1-associated proteins 1C-like isoform X2 [Phragmites australis]|nr:UBP1-associated proteins 1C-like isoform X2 [Phragmites australis]